MGNGGHQSCQIRPVGNSYRNGGSAYASRTGFKGNTGSNSVVFSANGKVEIDYLFAGYIYRLGLFGKPVRGGNLNIQGIYEL